MIWPVSYWLKENSTEMKQRPERHYPVYAAVFRESEAKQTKQNKTKTKTKSKSKTKSKTKTKQKKSQSTFQSNENAFL